MQPASAEPRSKIKTRCIQISPLVPTDGDHADPFGACCSDLSWLCPVSRFIFVPLAVSIFFQIHFLSAQCRSCQLFSRQEWEGRQRLVSPAVQSSVLQARQASQLVASSQVFQF